MSRAWVSFLSNRSGCEYTAAAIAALRWGAKKYVFLKPLALEPVPSAYLGRAAAKCARPLAAQPEHSCVRLFSGRSWLVGVSDAPRKLRGRLHRLTGAAQAPAKRLFGLLKVVFALYLGCCQNNKPAGFPATKKPRKAVPARPRKTHSRPRKSDGECETFPHMCPPHAAPESSRGRTLTVGRCARPWAAARRLWGVGLVCL